MPRRQGRHVNSNVACAEHVQYRALRQTSLGKVEHMGRVLQKFSPDNHESFAKLFQDRSPGSPAVLWAMRAPLQVYTVDGEKAEGLAGRFAAATGSDGSGSPPAACTSLAAKAKGVLPSLKLSTRCRLHSAQRSLENSLKSDGNIKILLDEFVMRLSSQNSKDPGGFCRAIGNSHKLLAQFSEKVQSQLDCVLGPQMSAHYAAQRFDSCTNCLQKLILCISSVVRFLLDLAALKNDKSAWAVKLLAAT